MNITLTKHIFGDLNINPSNLVGIYVPNNFEGEGLTDEEIIKAIQNPIGTKPLSDMVKGCKKILIVTDDNTRSTPLYCLLPPIIDGLKAAGVPDSGITFLIGLGTHRPMTEDEIKLKFGEEIFRKYRIINHAWNDPDALISLGTCELGFEVVINKLVLESDFLISVGSIMPHATTGFSGGGKTVMPGVCGERTIEDAHWMALNYSMAEILGNIDNLIQKVINSICRKVNHKMIVNTILYKTDKIYAVVAGDVERAHKRGVEICRDVYGMSISQMADIVIAEAYPTDIDLRQAIKAICAADIVCRDGGVIILPAECPEGIAPQFPEFARYGFRDPEKLYHDVEDGKFKQKLMAYTLIAIGRIISGRVKAILVSPNIDQGQAEHMGFIWASDLQSAVNKGFNIKGKNSKVIVLKQAGEILPILHT